MRVQVPLRVLGKALQINDLQSFFVCPLITDLFWAQSGSVWNLGDLIQGNHIPKISFLYGFEWNRSEIRDQSEKPVGMLNFCCLLNGYFIFCSYVLLSVLNSHLTKVSSCHYKIIAIHRFHLILEMPMNKAIAGESEGWNQVKQNIIGFTLSFQNILWAKTNIIIANENMLIANPLSGINRWTVRC